MKRKKRSKKIFKTKYIILPIAIILIISASFFGMVLYLRMTDPFYEVSKEVFDVFNDFELNDISTMHKDRKHIDFRSYDDSEVIENYLFNNSRKNYKYFKEK